MEISDDEKVYAIKDGTVLLHGNGEKHAKLYLVNIIETKNIMQPKLCSKHMLNLCGINRLSNNGHETKVRKEMITYYHNCCFSPVISRGLYPLVSG